MAGRRHTGGKARRFANEEGGASAVEFALIMPVFLFIVFVIFETATVYAGQRMLQLHASDLARRYRTGFIGQVQDTDPNGQPFMRPEDLCRDRAPNILLNCSNLRVDVRPTDQVCPAGTVGSCGNPEPASPQIIPGDSGTVNVVRVYYTWPRTFGIPVVPAGVPQPSGNVELYAASGFVTE